MEFNTAFLNKIDKVHVREAQPQSPAHEAHAQLGPLGSE